VRTYPESAADVDASLLREEGGVAVSCGHLSDDDTAEVDVERVERQLVVVAGRATERTVVVAAERVHLHVYTRDAPVV